MDAATQANDTFTIRIINDRTVSSAQKEQAHPRAFLMRKPYCIRYQCHACKLRAHG
jgi:hypothetical protein